MKPSKIGLIAIGCICLALGTIGVIIPILPTVPFYLVTAYCFAKSSERLDLWFKNTNLYRNHLEGFVRGRGMTVKTKVSIMVTVTAFMLLGFYMMDAVPIGRVMLAIVWAGHVCYFAFCVKTIK